MVLRLRWNQLPAANSLVPGDWIADYGLWRLRVSRELFGGCSFRLEFKSFSALDIGSGPFGSHEYREVYYEMHRRDDDGTPTGRLESVEESQLAAEKVLFVKILI